MAGFDASWELDLFGKVQRSLEAAVDDAEAQIDLRNAVLITVIADVARSYFEIRGLQIRLEIARKDVAEAKRTIDLVANDDVVAFTRLFDLMLLIPTTFPYLSDRRLGDAEANHADGNCHSSECESDTAQSLLPRSQVKSLSHRSAFAPLPGDSVLGPELFR